MALSSFRCASFFRIVRSHRLFLIAFFLLLLAAFVFRFFCSLPLSADSDVHIFQSALDDRIRHSSSRLDSLVSVHVNGASFPQLYALVASDEERDLTYGIYRHDTLVFWSNNQAEIPPHYHARIWANPFLHLPHAWSVRLIRKREPYTYVALIKIKNDWARPNEYLINDFATGFRMSSEVRVIEGSPNDPYPVFSSQSLQNEGTNEENSRTYLFSFDPDTLAGYGSWFLSFLSDAFFVIALFLFFWAVASSYRWLFNWPRMPLPYGFLLLLLLGLPLCYCLWEAWPSEFFRSDLFSPLWYASGDLFSSLGQLFFLTLFLFLAFLWFVVHGDFLRLSLFLRRHSRFTFFLLHALSVLFACFVYILFTNLIYNSTFSFVLTTLDDFSLPSFLAFCIVFFLLVVFVVFRYRFLILLRFPNLFRSLLLTNVSITIIFFFFLQTPDTSFFLPLWYFAFVTLIDLLTLRSSHSLFALSPLMSLLFIGSAFVVLFSLYHSRIRQQRKMVALAESLDSSDRLDRDVFSEVMFEDLNRRLSRDRRLALVDVDSTLRRRFPAMSPDSLPVDTAFLSPSTHNDGSEAMASSSLSDYLRRTYFRGYWNNYEIEVAPCFKNDSSVSVLTMRSFYERLLQSAEPIADTRFRYCPSHLSSFDYLARLETPDAFVYLAFRSVSSSSSFSYPTGLLRSDDEPDISQTLSLARYVNGICVTRRGRYDFPTDDRWIPLDRHSSSFSFSFNDATHFVWFSQRRPLQNSRPDIIVVTRPGTDSFTALLFFWACIFLFFAILVLLARFFYLAVRWWGNGRSSLSLGFVSKMQLAFFMLLMGAFLLVGVLSSFYMVRSYQHRRNATLLNRTRYIRKYLDESFRHSASLRILSREDLNFLCQDIASTYETDLHLYSPSGHLMASSQPFLFSRRLLSPLLNPMVLTHSVSKSTSVPPDGPSILTEHVGQLRYVASYAPLFDSSGRLIAWLCVPSWYSYDDMQRELFSLLSIMISIYLVILLVAAFLSLLVARQFARPLKLLSERLRLFRLRGSNSHLSYSGNDEISQLVAQYNRLVDQLEEAAERLALSERQSAWKQMARQVTHEIKNPLTPMRLSVQMLQRLRDSDDPERFKAYFDKTTHMLIEQIDTLSNIATAFSDFARMPEAKRRPLDIINRLQTSVELFQSNPEGVNVSLHISPDISKNPPSVLADPEQLSQVFSNLLKNAIQAIPRNQKVRYVSVSATSDRDYVHINFTDNGMGIPEEIRDRIFLPNFTTKSSGSGLGLAIVNNIVDSNNGKISFTTTTGKGTTFTISFPLLES